MKLVCLISGGIDSPVAAYLILKKKADLVFVHFYPEPFVGEDSLKKTKLLVEKLSKISKKKFKLYIIKNGPIMAEIVKKCDRSQTCVLCRRFMYKISEKIAENEKAKGLVTGEALAQVASQTLPNLFVEDNRIKIPVVRPLVGFDKDDVIKIANEIGTFNISILPGQCCNLTPTYPETRAFLDRILEEEKKLDVGKLIGEALKNFKIEYITWK